MQDNDRFRLSPEELRAQRRRSVAIALVLVALIVTFYAVTVIKLAA